MHSRYGGSVIRRQSFSLNPYSTAVEVRLKRFPVVILPTSKLFEGGDQLMQLDVVHQVQISKKDKYSDLKKRIADCLHRTSGAEEPITDERLRLWKFADHKERLLQQCGLISTRTSQQEDSRMTDESDPELEENSGVDFPGESLEPFLKTAQTLEDDTLEAAHLVVEYKDRDSFAFKF